MKWEKYKIATLLISSSGNSSFHLYSAAETVNDYFIETGEKLNTGHLLCPPVP
jgi:hypothetical protein